MLRILKIELFYDQPKKYSSKVIKLDTIVLWSTIGCEL